jgi:putative ABC transport system permease protein
MRERPGFRRLLRPTRRPSAIAREVDDEIQSHLEQRVDELVAAGRSPDSARVEAVRRFGGAADGLEGARQRLRTEAAARTRRTNRREWLLSVRQDLAFAVRQARRAPWHSAMVVLVLALGIGASTAMFTVLNAVLLRPLPFPEPDRLAVIWSLDSLGTKSPASPKMWADWQAQARAFERIALLFVNDVAVEPASRGADALTAREMITSENFFDVMRPRLRLGRAYTEADTALGARLVVVSERFWRDVLGAPARLPVTLTVGGRAWDVIGVLARGVEYPADADLWVMSGFRNSLAPRNYAAFTAVGRLAPGRTLAQADRELDIVMAGIRAREPDALYAHGATIESLRDALVGGTAQSIRLVAAAGLLMLLIACANAATASLVRSSARARELAIRASLGAGRGRILRQLVTEQVMLAGASGLLGLWLAHVGTGWLARSAATALPRMQELRFDARVIGVAAGCSLLSAAIAGLLPMIIVRRASLRGALANGLRTSGAGGGLRLGRLLVGAEVAVALVLLSGAALLIESIRTLVGRDLGFTTRNIAMVRVTLLPPRYKTVPPRTAYLQELERQVRAVPGVAAVAFSTAPPLGKPYTGGVAVEGSTSNELVAATYRIVTEEYFQTIGIPLVEGRGFDAHDVASAPRVTIVNRTMARRLWPGESAIGKRLRTDMEGKRAPWLTVVGVVGDTRHWGPASEPAPEHYVPYAQMAPMAWGMTLVVRTSIPVDRVVPAIRARMRPIDPAIPPDVRPLEAQIDQTALAWRLPTSIVGIFGAVALVLAMLGIYTVFAFLVAQRTREIGVRMALGATGGAVLRATVHDALRVTLAGIAVGSLGAYWLTGFARTFLFAGTPVDVRPLAVAVVVLMATAALAAYVPARRAARVDPTVTLRAD